MRVQRIGQGARGPQAGLLAGLAARWAWRCRAARPARGPRGGCRQGCSGNGGLARAEVEQRGQVAADGAAPGRDVGFGHAEALLDEAQHRGVVEDLRVDPAAARPGRQRVHGHARSQAIDAVPMRGRIVGFHARDNLVVFAARVHRRGAGQRARIARGRGGRRHVVEEAVVLVEHQQQHRAAPDLWIGGQRVQHARHIVGALGRAGRAGMLGAGLGGADPRYLRQRAVQRVLAQPVQAVRAQRLFAQRRQRAGQALIGVAVGLEAGGGIERVVVRHVW